MTYVELEENQPIRNNVAIKFEWNATKSFPQKISNFQYCLFSYK